MYYFYYLFKSDNLLLRFAFSIFDANLIFMETASFNGFIKTLFIIIAVWYIMKFLGRIFLPILIKKMVSKAGQSFQQQQAQYDNTRRYNDNEVRLDTDTPNKRPREKKKVGEYVDYEELD